ncbi:DinB family protein [Paenibacillus sp. GCM10023252]|uniref:DinB family protein n=1 Tax=Paenibacillus sp. GCM10023252 TaxID=3252649 RepID=UPI003613CA30
MEWKQSNEAFGQALVKSLIGERGHLPVARGVGDMSWELAGRGAEGIPYTIYQLVWHMQYWQTFMLTYAEGGQPTRPTSAQDSWTEQRNAPSDEQWKELQQQFLRGIDRACELAQTIALDELLPGFPVPETRGGMLRNIASHNSYHLGEIVLLRRLNGAWPPVGGGYPA